MGEAVRVRLSFEDRHLLSKSQKCDGLKQCWLLLKPELRTISELASHLLHKFDLQQACPNGLLLSMDDFVLPPFESTCIFKDKDVIRVSKKGGKLKEVIRIDNEANNVEDSESMKEQPMLSGVNLLAIKEFEEEPEAHQWEHEENQCDTPEDAMPLENSLTVNTATKKRKKHSNKLPSSKRKKIRSSSPRKYLKASIEEAEKDVHTEEKKSCYQKRQPSQRSLKGKERSSNQNGTQIVITQNTDDGDKKIVDSTSCEERDDIVKDNGPENGDTSEVLHAPRKFPSRSARRKKAKRQWLRGLANSQSKEQIPSFIQEKEMHKNYQGHQQPDQHVDEEDEIVPIVVRPGHIRFEPLDEAEQGHQQLQLPVETLQWNGPTSKKKGQKWGKEKPSVCRRNDEYDSYEECNKKLTVEEGELLHDPIDFERHTPLSCLPKETLQWNGPTSKKKGQKWGQEKPSVWRRNDDNDSYEECNKKLTVDEGELPHDSIDFEKLTPLSCLPKEGDVVAYRLVELSSSWCPELSSFRVGKISSYDPVSGNVILVPLPGYPIVSDEQRDEVEDTLQSNISLYKEDGSLEVNFSSLVDVRIFDHRKPDQVTVVSGRTNEAPASIQEPRLDDGEKACWEEISQALNAKKAQLLKEDGWPIKECPVKTAWSYKAMRGSALGPTMALLRSLNEL